MGATNSVSKKDLKFLLANTAYNRKTIKCYYKGFQKDSPSGKLSVEEFTEIYRGFFPFGNGDAFCEHVFRAFDSDDNGFIDFKEFLMAIHITSLGSPAEKIKSAFRYFLSTLVIKRYKTKNYT